MALQQRCQATAYIVMTVSYYFQVQHYASIILQNKFGNPAKLWLKNNVKANNNWTNVMLFLTCILL